MYKFKREKQISFTDFNQPQGMQMNPNNRWVRRWAGTMKPSRSKGVSHSIRAV